MKKGIDICILESKEAFLIPEEIVFKSSFQIVNSKVDSKEQQMALDEVTAILYFFA